MNCANFIHFPLLEGHEVGSFRAGALAKSGDSLMEAIGDDSGQSQQQPNATDKTP